MNNRIFIGLLSLLSVFLISCSPASLKPNYGTAIDYAHADLQAGMASNARLAGQPKRTPAAISAALVPQPHFNFPQATQANERRFNVTANNMEARAFFMGLVEGTQHNMLVNDNVKGTITLNLKNVTVDQALQAVRDVYGYQFNRTAYGFEVEAAALDTRIFTVNYLDVKRTGRSLTTLSTGQISEKVGTSGGSSSGGGSSNSPQPASVGTGGLPLSGSNVSTSSESDFWKDLAVTLKTMVGDKDGRSVVVNPQAGIIIVRAMPIELKGVARYLQRTQASLQRQVILEAKILEVELDDNYQAGIDWNAFGFSLATGHGGVAQAGIQEFTNTNLKDFQSMFTVKVNGKDFNTLIHMLQTQGNVQVLSSPRISTLNNQKAVIKAGNDSFFVTGISTNNTTTNVVGAVAAPTQDVELTPFFSGITLDVTPHITREGAITLHIHPSVSNVTEQRKIIQAGNNANSSANIFDLPLAKSTIRESDNIVEARNGQVIVIGSMMSRLTREDMASSPGITKVPFLGAFFRNTQQTSIKSELVILLRPVIVENSAWCDDMYQSDQRMQTVNRGFHAGGLPEVFGAEGEVHLDKG